MYRFRALSSNPIKSHTLRHAAVPHPNNTPAAGSARPKSRLGERSLRTSAASAPQVLRPQSHKAQHLQVHKRRCLPARATTLSTCQTATRALVRSVLRRCTRGSSATAYSRLPTAYTCNRQARLDRRRAEITLRVRAPASACCWRAGAHNNQNERSDFAGPEQIWGAGEHGKNART